MSQALRVLIVEDSDADSRLLLHELREGGYEPQARRVATVADLTAALAAQEWDVVISDYRLPQFDVLDALKLVQATGRDLPFILVSGAVGEEQAVAVMKAGAHDFLLKDRLAPLAPAVARTLGDAESRRHRRQAEEMLKASLHEKEVLLREIHHRVKNNLQIVSSLLNLQSRDLTDPAMIEAFTSARNRVQAMAAVHEQLYECGTFAQIDLAAHLRSLARKLTHAFAPARAAVQPVLRFEPVMVDLNTAVPLSLVANELITNALKYGFTEGRQGTLTLELRTEGGHHELRIADDGPGFPPGLDPRHQPHARFAPGARPRASDPR